MLELDFVHSQAQQYPCIMCLLIVSKDTESFVKKIIQS